MAEEAAQAEESDLSDFEIDDEIKHELNSLMNLEFIETSSEDDDEAEEEKEETKENEPEKEVERRPRGDSLERELEMMFMSQHKESGGGEEGASKDTGLESISDNELDGPESGECDTSDGELPDSPSIVVTVPDTPPINVQGVEDLSGSSDVELVDEYQAREYYDAPQKPAREVIIETREKSPVTKKGEKSPSKSKEKPVEKAKKEKKDKSKKKDVELSEDEKRRLKLEKYLARLEMYKAKCREYMKQITKKYDYMKKTEKTKIKLEKSKMKNLTLGEPAKLKSIVKEVNRDISPLSSTSSKLDRSSHSSRGDKSHFPPISDDRGRRSSSEKERKSKHKKIKNKSKELKEHKKLYQQYLQYLQVEREKCLEEGSSVIERIKKQKKRKSKSKSPDKRKELSSLEKKGSRPPILSFSEFCDNRELVSPEKEPTKIANKVKSSHDADARKERTVSIDSAATTATVRSDPMDPTDDDKELFITITDLEQQDKLRKEKRNLEQDKEKIETELEKDPGLKSISVFTSVLFKGGSDSEVIPFLSSEGRPTSPKPTEVEPKKPFIHDTGIDEIYDMNDDLSNISQSSLSPSRSPVPKLHNKSLLNFLENQKERQERLRKKSPEKISKSSRSRSKSPRRERSRSKKRKRKHYSSISTISPSPPPLRSRSPDPTYRKRPSPPAYLKERWKDYPSPPEHRLMKREHRLARRRSRSRGRKVHRSRSSSEERDRHYRRYRSRSRSRSPPPVTMVQLTAAEKRRQLREDHERALESLRETIRKPLSNTPLSITIRNHGDNYEAIRDNYDPVLMNEDSSSNSPSEAEPSLPPLPPEPPPPKPAPPTAEKRDDVTVVTTYTSFMPNIIPAPMPVPSFGNWMPPVPDIQRPNMMFPPPQIMNNYNTPSPQQHFPFMTQPPPPLPYQMAMPPPCHQHYRMPSQAAQGVNIVSVRQEVKNIKSNPILITQISDEDENQIHPLEGSKCKHNPLGPDNQTVQEAIDSVKKCLKTCDALKNKDPRLAVVDDRQKSPGRSDSSSKSVDNKVKITLNYKPRPISDAEQTCVFEAVNEEPDDTISGLGECNKQSDNYTEKSSKIEGIVSKLKDNINSSSNLSLEGDEKCGRNRGDEPYDPFNVSDDIVESSANSEEQENSSPDKRNDNIHTFVLNDSRPKLSGSEIENINDQINKSFAFILSHSIERKRLTPTLSSILAKKAEKQKKSEVIEKIASISKANLTSQDSQRSKDKSTDLTLPRNACNKLSAGESNSLNQGSGITVNNSVKSQENTNQCGIPLTAKVSNPVMPANDVNQTHQMEFKDCDFKNNDTEKQSSSTRAINLSCNQKVQNKEVSDSESCSIQADSVGARVNIKPLNNDVPLYKSKYNEYSNNEKTERLYDVTEDGNIKGLNTIQSSVCKNKNSDDNECNLKNRKSPTLLDLRHYSQKHEESLDTERNKTEYKQNLDVDQAGDTNNVTIEYTFGINVDFVEKRNIKQFNGKTNFGESKNHFNLERKTNPPLSIPTKGELKRFPTPERCFPGSTTMESHVDTGSNLPKVQKQTHDTLKENDESKGIDQIERNNSIPSTTKMVESILHDFDESNSTSCDFLILNRGKNVNDCNSGISRISSPKSNFGNSPQGKACDSTDLAIVKSLPCTSNKVTENHVRDHVPNLKRAKSECHSTEAERDMSMSGFVTVSKSKSLQEISQKYNTSEEDVSSEEDYATFTADKFSGKDNLTKDEFKEISEKNAALEENKNAGSVRRSQRKAKTPKYKFYNEGKYDIDSPKQLVSVEKETFKNSLPVEEKVFDNFEPSSDVEKHPDDNDSQNVESTKPVHLKNPTPSKKPCKPCPLSRKSKSYISQNLPLSFDLSVDGHLIRRGFKKLRVNVQRLAQQPKTARPPDNNTFNTTVGVSSSCLNGANSDKDCYVDLAVENALGIIKKVSAGENQDTIEKQIKRVSFDLNVSEIFDDSKFSTDDEISRDTKISSDLNCEEPTNDSNGANKMSYRVDVEHSCDRAVGAAKIEKLDDSKSASSDCNQDISPEKCDEAPLNSISLFYEELANTLVTLRNLPMPQMRKRKTIVVSIPSIEEMPSAKILDSIKKPSKVSSRKAGLQEEGVDISINPTKTEEENCSTKSNNAKNKSKKDSLCNEASLSGKKYNNLEVGESDNDDSMILDRELSDLAKGCLDSDSNVGEDDDSVLNFGIQASDDSSVDSDFNSKNKNVFSRKSTRQKSKLSSPQNIKKRFARKHRSINASVELKSNEGVVSDSICKNENELFDGKSGESPQSVTIKTSLKTTDRSTPEVKMLSQQIPLDIKVTQNIADRKEVEHPSISNIEGDESHNSSSTSLGLDVISKTTRRKGRRQKNKAKKPLISTNKDSEENLNSVEATNKTSERKPEQTTENKISVDSQLHDLDDTLRRNTHEGISYQSCKNDVRNKNEDSQNSDGIINDNLPLVDTSKESINRSDALDGNENNDMPLDADATNKMENTCFLKSDEEDKEEDKSCNSSVVKSNDARKTRRGKPVVTNTCNKPLPSNSPETVEDLDLEMKNTEVTVTRKTRRGRPVHSTTKYNGGLKITSQSQVQEDVANDPNDQFKASEIVLDVKDSRMNRKSKKISNNHYNKQDDEKDCIDEAKESSKHKVTYEAGSANECTVKNESKNPLTNNKLERDELTLGTENTNNDLTKEDRKLDNVYSTSPQIIPLEFGRKTRLSSKKSVVSNDKMVEKSLGIDLVTDMFLTEKSVSLAKMTKRKKHICDTSEGDALSKANNYDHVESLEQDELDLDIKTDDIKVQQGIERSRSTESLDEPLIVVKNKLLVDKNKQLCNGSTSDSTQRTTDRASPILSEDNKLKCKSAVTNTGSSNNSPGNTKERNVSSEENNLQGTRNSGNEFNSSNPSSNNSLSNSGNNRNPYFNMDGASNLENDCCFPVDASNKFTFMNQNFFSSVNSQSIYSSIFQQKCSINPKLKEAMRKKRDKAEVDAEIKRRLAEIDELEKLARSQHANVLEKIGARTRSQAQDSQSVIIDEEDDIVSISSEDSQSTSVGTNDATTSSKIIDSSKCEDVNEEPTTTQVDVMRICDETLVEKTPFDVLFKGSVSISPINTRGKTKKKKINNIESEKNSEVDKTCHNLTKSDMNVSSFHVDKSFPNDKMNKDNLINKTSSINLPSHTHSSITLQVSKEHTDRNGQRPKKHEPLSLSGNYNKNKIDVVSVYQFTDSEDSEEDKEICLKQKYNCISRENSEIKDKKKTNPTSSILKNNQNPQEKSKRKIKHGNAALEIKPREVSPINMISRKPCESSCNDQSESIVSSNIITEPDSSTSVIETCNRSGDLKSTGSASKDGRSTTQGEDINIVVSSNNTSNESDMIPSSPVRSFKQPYRKTLVTRRKIKRRSYFGRCLMSSNNLRNTNNDSLEDSSDHTTSQSEEVVSSSVNTEQNSQDKKKRRRRKTVMDLLMEDSMLSVTRDFPMSPNPYMFSSFYKDIDLPNTSSKSGSDSTISEHNTKKINEDRGLPLKPDFLAQKLRILEKLKSISRKNRKTRQCRTLVCYNEDSLPESLVESPVGETAHTNSDMGIISQNISRQINLDDNDGECSTKLLDGPSNVPLNNTLEDGINANTTFESSSKREIACSSKVPLKRGRKSKASKSVKTLNENEKSGTNLSSADNVCLNENAPKEDLSSSTFPETKDAINQSSSNLSELSEFDKLLLGTKSRDTSRMKLLYNYDPASPRSSYEDKSDDSPDDFFNLLPSPRQSSDDESLASENLNDDHSSSSHRTNLQKTNVFHDDNSKSKFIKPEKIVCSILKTKIGKLLPYFGNTSSDESGDLDEDIPLSVKLTQFNDGEIEFFKPSLMEEEENSFNSAPARKSKRPVRKAKYQKLKGIVSLTETEESVRSTRSKTANLAVEDCDTSDTWGEIRKKDDILNDSLKVNCDSPVQLRKSNRKLKTRNFLCREMDDNFKQTFNEVKKDNQGNGVNNEKNLDSEVNAPLTLKKKGRPSRTKLVEEKIDNFETTEASQSNEFSEIGDTDKIVASQDVSPTENKTRGKNPEMIEDEQHVDIGKSPLHFMKKYDDYHEVDESMPAIKKVEKGKTLRISRPKSGKRSLEFENIDENSAIEKCEQISFRDNVNDDYSLEDLPLNKRADREMISGKRSKKENFASSNRGHYSSRENSETRVLESHELSGDISKDVRDSSNDRLSNDSPPPLIRTRARRAKLSTSENNYLDPPNLEIPEDPVNAVHTCGSSENSLTEETSLPPRKRGRKPKTDISKMQAKSDENEGPFKTASVIPAKDHENNKTHDTDELPNKSNCVSNSCIKDTQVIPKKRGRRGKRKSIHTKSGRKFNRFQKEADSDYDSEVEVNIQGLPKIEETTAGNNQQDEHNISITDMREDAKVTTGECGENTDFAIQVDGRKRKRKTRDQDEINTNCDCKINSATEAEPNTESEDVESKRIKISEESDEGQHNHDVSPSTSSKEQPTFTSLNCANQPFLWNKISAFLNKSTRSVGTQVKVKNMVLKGFETFEPEVSLQSELTLPQVIKTLFEELRFIDSSFSNP